jgi:glucokinase
LIAGIDLGGTQVRVAAARSDGRLQAVSRARTASVASPAAFVEWVSESLRSMAGRGRVRAIGVGVPGPIDAARGVLVNPPNLSGWSQVPLVAMLGESTGAAVHLGNDANLAALGEYHQGAGRRSRDLVYITWSTGIGSGIVLDGRLYQGAHGTAGELGHTIIDPDGPLCTCGQRGCLEQLAAGHGITAQTGRPAADVFERAAAGDAESRLVVGRAARYVGLALVNVTNVLDPDVIVVGGGIVRSWGLVRSVLEETLRASPFIRPARRPRVLSARLGDRAGLVGAVEWARANR